MVKFRRKPTFLMSSGMVLSSGFWPKGRKALKSRNIKPRTLNPYTSKPKTQSPKRYMRFWWGPGILGFEGLGFQGLGKP